MRMVCERKTREIRKDMIGDNPIEGDMLPFLFKDEDEIIYKSAPIAYLPDLEHHIMKTLDELDR